jgi:phosphonate transport system ATP-binding protein
VESAASSKPGGAARDAGATGAALVIEGLTKEYVKGRPVLRGIDLAFASSGVTAIIGPSCTGKSTLIRCINRLVEPTSGRLLFHGEDIAHLDRPALRRMRGRIGMVFQEYNLVERLSVMENLLCGRLGYLPVWRAFLRRFPREDIERAFVLLDRVGLPSQHRQRADALSGGQRQRVGIARALMQRPDLLLADEPTSSLDPRTAVGIMGLIAELAAELAIPVIVNIHNVELARRFADRVVGMKDGSVVFDGAPHELRDDHLKFIYGGEDWL